MGARYPAPIYQYEKLKYFNKKDYFCISKKNYGKIRIQKHNYEKRHSSQEISPGGI